MEGFSICKGHKKQKRELSKLNKWVINLENNTNVAFIDWPDYEQTQGVTYDTDVGPLRHVDQCMRVQILSEHVTIELW